MKEGCKLSCRFTANGNCAAKVAAACICWSRAGQILRRIESDAMRVDRDKMSQDLTGGRDGRDTTITPAHP